MEMIVNTLCINALKTNIRYIKADVPFIAFDLLIKTHISFNSTKSCTFKLFCLILSYNMRVRPRVSKDTETIINTNF